MVEGSVRVGGRQGRGHQLSSPNSPLLSLTFVYLNFGSVGEDLLFICPMYLLKEHIFEFIIILEQVYFKIL